MTTDTEALATRIEQAGPESQAELLGDAFDAIHAEEGDDWSAATQTDYGRFTAMLDCGAYLSAAEMFVPDGYDWIVGHTNNGLTIYAEVGGTGGDFTRFASTPALALAAACLRAAIAGKES